MAKRKTAPSSAPAASRSTRQTRQTRQTEAAAESSAQRKSASQGAVRAAPKSSGQDPIPRRFAPRSKRGESITTAASPATEDFPKSSYDERSSVSKRQDLSTVPEPGEEASDQKNGGDEDTEEQPSLDPEMVEFVLSELSRSSDKLFELIQAGKEPASLGFVENLFFTARRAFATDEDFFISNEQRDQALANTKQESQLDNARKTVCSANVTALSRLLAKIQKGDIALRPVLNDLVPGFPQLFDVRTDRSHEDDEKILDLAFGIRCCCLVDKIKAARSNKPFLLAAEVFCGEAVKSAEEAKELLLDGTNHLVTGVDDDFSEKYFNERLERLCSYLEQNTKAKVTEGLEKEYDLATLLTELGEWAQTVFDDLKEGPIVRRPREGDPSALEIDYTMESAAGSRAPPSNQQQTKSFSAANQRKRQLARVDEDDEGDVPPTQATSSPAKRTRIAQNDFASSASRATSVAVSQAQTEIADGELHPVDIPTLTQSAKANTRKAKPKLSSGPQRRTFWSDADVVKLIQALAKHECAWSTIERKVHFSVYRNQQAIRDKARNLKVDFLKADSILPAGFDGVALGKKERDLVIKCRRNPDRMEADVRDGRVINEIYLPPDVEAEYDLQFEQEAQAEAEAQVRDEVGDHGEGEEAAEAEAEAEAEGEEHYHDAQP